MSAWTNNDKRISKPKFDMERETRKFAQFTVLTGNTAGNNVIQVSYTDGGQNNVANIGVAAGQYVYFWSGGFSTNNGGQAGNGVPNMFASNTTVSSISGNTITLSTALFNTVTAGFGVEFDKAIVYPAAKTVEKTFNADTVLVTPTRIANTAVNVGNMNTGWTQIRKKTNSDGSVRYLSETLVALANPTAANTASGNTSWGRAFSGL
jgi:hypothetical protein